MFTNAVIHENSLNFDESAVEIYTKTLLGVSLDKKTLLKCTELATTEIVKTFDVSQDAAEKIHALVGLVRSVSCKSDVKRIQCPGDAADILIPRLRHLKHEVIICIALDSKGKMTDSMQLSETETEPIEINADILHIGKIFQGTLNSSLFHPREIFRFAISSCANSIMIAHNHPSGDPYPSREDIAATKNLIDAGDHIGIKVLDHIIIGDNCYHSMKEEGTLDE